MGRPFAEARKDLDRFGDQVTEGAFRTRNRPLIEVGRYARKNPNWYRAKAQAEEVVRGYAGAAR